MTWNFSQVWNNSLLEREERPITPRNRIWASELGKSPIDVWLKMKGEKPTNPPNPRSLRKFEAGNVFEWIVNLILLRAGIMRETQKWVSHQYEGLLEVTGKIDFIAGGKPDYEKAITELDKLMLPDVFMRAGKNIISHLEKTYPQGIEEQPLEIKSVSAFMFDAMETNSRGLAIHRKQLFHYLKSMNYPHGNLVYICRDDLRMNEFTIFNNEQNENEYKKDIELISGYYQRDEQPPLEQPIIFDEDLKKFAKNFNVAYSLYLTKLYGFKDQAEFDDKFSPTTESWNRVLSRLKEKKEMTDNNKEKVAEMEKQGFNLETIKKSICSKTS